jgi:hypothetical protein
MKVNFLTKKNKNIRCNIKNDTHNVHDRTVNELSKEYYQYLLDNTIIVQDINNIVKHMENFIEKKILSILDKNLILNYINFILINNDFILNFNCNEYDFLILCWNRTLMPENKNNIENIQINILNNILDFYSTQYNGLSCLSIKKLCCTSGRIMKLLSSFCLLDNNKDLGSFISTNILQKEFLYVASTLYKSTYTLEEYNSLLNNTIKKYNKIYHNTLKSFKNTLLESLIFENKE